MTLERRQTIKLTLIVALASFTFSSLGTLITQSFIVGKYAQTIEENSQGLKELTLDLKEHKIYDNEIYLKKEVFEESVKARNMMLEIILKKLEVIESKLSRF
jgi:hypothetical protein